MPGDSINNADDEERDTREDYEEGDTREDDDKDEYNHDIDISACISFVIFQIVFILTHF